jgi:hypothetical protein
MAKLTLFLACGHEVERTLRADRLPDLAGVHVPCVQCQRLRPVQGFKVHPDGDEDD